ncbi:MAG TPA: phospho-sugar mutase, partial [Bacillota bacterium]|nr:phospho-sugar mutase [Bacillota bacterium]
MNINELYALWSQDPYFNESTRKELQELSNNAKEIEERFYRELEFGTGGLRGIIGAGTNRMNLYTVAKASQGLARYILSSGEEAVKQGVVISYDSRNFSPEFASQAARTLTANGIRVYLSDELRPVPVLSYSVRYFKAFAGIMITASHNPSKYNGYKVYGEDGGQVPPEAATEILNNITAIEDIRTVVPDTMDDAKAKGLLTMFGSEVDAAYTDMLETLVIDRDAITRQSNMSIVYTPLHGSGNKPVRRILERVGFKNVHVVPEQELPNGDFPTVEVPNPENPAALSMAIALAKKVNADIVLGTDPDSDRVGVAARTIENGEEIYKSFTGNQIGLLLLDYVLASKKASGTLPEKSFAVTTIVSSKLAGTICQHYGVELQEVLTGFKFIGERIKLYDEEGDMSFQFGFEESYGYLTGVNVRDKDAVDAVMLIAGMAAQSFDKGESLIDRLNGLYEKYGYGFEEAVSFTLEGKEGVEKIANAMSVLRGKVTSMTAATEKNVLGGIPFDAVRDDSSL